MPPILMAHRSSPAAVPSFDIGGVEGKLGRAEHHLTTLMTVLSPHRVERGPFARVEPGHSHLLVARPELPTTDEPDARELGLIVGDFLSNARSALDHLAYTRSVLLLR